MKSRHVLSVLVENRFGELARVVGLFSGRGFNIDSLAVNVTLDPAYSRIVLTTRGNEAIIEQIIKQLRKLVRVNKVVLMSDEERFIERELCVVTVGASTPNGRQELERIVKLAGARVVAYSAAAFTVETTATSAEIDEFIDLLRPLGIKDMVRSAPIALPRPASEGTSDTAAPSSAA